jgi:hypothetical protein
LNDNPRQLTLALRRRLREATALLEVVEPVGAGRFLDSILEDSWESRKALIPYDPIGGALLDLTHDCVVAKRARPMAPRSAGAAGCSQALAESSLARAMDSRRPRIINDREQHLAEHPDSTSTRLLVGELVQPGLTCPLVVQGRTTYCSSAATNKSPIAISARTYSLV